MRRNATLNAAIAAVLTNKFIAESKPMSNNQNKQQAKHDATQAAQAPEVPTDCEACEGTGTRGIIDSDTVTLGVFGRDTEDCDDCKGSGRAPATVTAPAQPADEHAVCRLMERNLTSRIEELEAQVAGPAAQQAAPTGTLATPLLSAAQFRARYMDAKMEGGDTWTDDELEASWQQYKRDPIGHFLSKP